MQAQRTAFVTGGSGFIGGRLVRRLVSEGWKVRALARSERAAAAVRELGAEPAPGDLTDANAMAAGADGAAVAFHLAAHLGQWGPRTEFERGNVTGTENALAACARAGVGRFVHCGTEAALMAGEPLVNVDESAPLRPDSSPLLGDQGAGRGGGARADREGFRRVRASAPRVGGGGHDAPTRDPGRRRERPLRLDRRRRSSHVYDPCRQRGRGASARRGARSSPEAYFVTDGEPVVFRAFVSELISTQGLRPPGRSLPDWAARGVAAASELAWRRLPLKGEPLLTRLAYWLSAHECTLDISKARSELGYEPRRSIAEELAEMREPAWGAGARLGRMRADRLRRGAGPGSRAGIE